MNDDDPRESRNRDARSRADSEGRTVAAPHSPRRHVGRVVNPPPPGAAAPLYRDTHPVRISGPDKAGATAVLAVDTTLIVPVLVFGSVPPAGQDLVARNYRGRWEAYVGPAGGGSGGGGVPWPGCFCSPGPDSIAMTSADPDCNFRMFQSCTIRWYSPVPSGFEALNLGQGAYLSTDSFPDPVDGGALFYYLLTCQFNQVSLTRVYLVSDYGSPYRDGILYTWLLSNPDNSCAPFRLHAGFAYPGSDQSCHVELDG
jgi:hypothetical protein